MIEERPAGALPAPETDNLGQFSLVCGGALSPSLSLPAFILAASFVGFAGGGGPGGGSGPGGGGAGITITQARLHDGRRLGPCRPRVVLVGAIMAGNGLIAAAFAVGLSAVRLTPMVVALVPEMRTPQTRTWVLYLLSHFVRRHLLGAGAGDAAQRAPRAAARAYYGGLRLDADPAQHVRGDRGLFGRPRPCRPTVSAALLLITPIYFLTSLWGSARRRRAGNVAMALGLVIGPIVHVIAPGASLLATGGHCGPFRLWLACLDAEEDDMTFDAIDAWWWPYVFNPDRRRAGDRHLALPSAVYLAGGIAEDSDHPGLGALRGDRVGGRRHPPI